MRMEILLRSMLKRKQRTTIVQKAFSHNDIQTTRITAEIWHSY